jgi:hypothetical protein
VPNFGDALGNNTGSGLFFGNGDGSFRSAGTILEGFASRFVAVGDFNHDDILDLAVVGIAGVHMLLAREW